jgi:predicted kinase
MRQRFDQRGIAWCIIEAHADDRTVRRRLREREAHPDEISDARLDDFAALTRLYTPPTELPKNQCARIRTTTPIEKTLTLALGALARRHVESIRAS